MSGPEPTPRTFLVAEEDAVQRTLLREVLATLGPGRVDEAGDGPSAPAQAQARRPDLILLDYELPPAGGGAVVAGLRADAALAGVPVLVLAYSDGPADPGGGEATGGAPWLRKPYDLGALEQSILAVLPAPAPRPKRVPWLSALAEYE